MPICRRRSVQTRRRDHSSSKTTGDLQNALRAPNNAMIFVESIMDPHDAPAAITMSSNKGADLDYGPRGPQRHDNLQLRPAT
jgi:indolepyruvate decarboxylase